MYELPKPWEVDGETLLISLRLPRMPRDRLGAALEWTSNLACQMRFAYDHVDVVIRIDRFSDDMAADIRDRVSWVRSMWAKIAAGENPPPPYGLPQRQLV